jgi:hypothetical protein
MIKKFFSNRHRAGWKYDGKRKQYYSWGFDIRLSDGRRKREAGFFSETEVQSVLARIRLAEKDLRYGFIAQQEARTSRSLQAEGKRSARAACSIRCARKSRKA